MKYFALIAAMFSLSATAQNSNVNIRTSVTSTTVIDRPNIRADFRLGEKVSLGVEVANQSYDDTGVSVKGFGGGVYTTLYTRGTFESGWMVDFGLTYTGLKGEATVAGLSRNNSGTSVGVSVRGGYHWFWDPFNLSLGIGYASNSEDRLRIKDASGATVATADLQPISMAYDFSIGLSF